MSPSDIRDIQRTLNGFTHKFLRGVAPLHVDGVRGRATNSRIMLVKYFLGYGTRDASWKSITVRRIRHPHDRKYFPPNGQMFREGFRRRLKQRAQWAAHKAQSALTPGVTSYDGVPVAKCAVPILNWCRAHGWHGRLVSGYRSPAYSDSLCRRLCGRPSCPGICAGRASNHSGNSPARFAIDVSDYFTFASVVSRCPVRPHIFNALPRDRVHFSPSGR